MNGCQISPKGSQIGPKAPNTAPLRRKKKGGLGYILNWLKGDQSKRQQAEGKVYNSGIGAFYVRIYWILGPAVFPTFLQLLVFSVLQLFSLLHIIY